MTMKAPAGIDESDVAWPLRATMIALEDIDSSSDHAARLAREGPLQPPFIVWARRQTRGRGQRDNQWWSDSGSLTFTLALDPIVHGLRREHEPRLALTTAVAVIDALHRLDLAPPGLGVRWPNDLEVSGRKLGGILPEPIETALGRRVLLGVGLNLTSRFDQAPAEVQSLATSLEASLEHGLEANLPQRLLREILGRLELALPMLARDDFSLAARWRSLDLLLDQWITVEREGTSIEGLCRGIGDDGALKIEGPRGVIHLLAGRVIRKQRP